MCRKSTSFCFALLMGLHLVAATAFAADGLARLQVGGGLLEWQPQVDAEEFTLRLAGPDGVVRSWRFPASTVPSLSLYDQAGKPLPDGLYTYELLAAPRLPKELQGWLEAARARGNAAAMQRLQGQVPRPLVQAGTFRISEGAILTGDQGEPEPGSRTKDQMVPDDLIVDGKGCVGLGCANGEAFGAEAMRLKQSVVRLRFEDTSTTAGFPTRDWQLAINDAGTGGADRFSIDDLTAATTPFTVRGGAPNHSLYLDPAGNVGLSTSVPAAHLHLSGAATQSVRLDKIGVPARTWDLAADGSSFRVVDVTNASAVPLQVAAGAPSNSLTITSNGKVGIGTDVPAGFLSVFGSAPGDSNVKMRNTSSSGYSGVEFYDHLGDSRFFFGVNNNNFTTRLNSVNNTPMLLMTESNERIRIQPTGFISLGCPNPTSRLVIGSSASSCATAPFSSINPGASTFTTSSSRSYKENLERVELPDILERIADVGVYTYDFIGGPKGRLGLVAEEFHQIFGRGSDKVIEGGEIEMALWLAVQQLAQRNQELEARNQRVEQRLAAIDEGSQIEAQRELIRQLEERLARLEGKR